MNKDDYFAQHKLARINYLLTENIEDLFDALDIEYTRTHKMLMCACPIHGGDNKSAFNIYTEELPNGTVGNWKCRTHQCEEKFGNNPLAFLRGCLDLTWSKTVDWACNFLGISLDKLKSDTSSSDIEKRKFAASVRGLKTQAKERPAGITRSQVRDRLIVPCDYYINRGYSPEILDKYDVGFCNTKGKRMYKRAVVPIYDSSYEYAVGFTGRATFDDYKYKWVHNTGFLANDHLYNYWFAKEHIMNTGCVILVEGPGDVWRLEENGIHISVAMFGTELSDQQMSLLYGSGANSIIVLTDNDNAGEKASMKINEKCKRLFRMFFPKMNCSDVGELGSDDITSDIQPILEQAGIY